MLVMARRCSESTQLSYLRPRPLEAYEDALLPLYVSPFLPLSTSTGDKDILPRLL